jgi:hypothetical protein
MFIWRDGLKIYVGGSSSRVKIFSFNSGTGLYDTNPTITPTIGTTIVSIWVTYDGLKLYAATNTGSYRIDWDGTNWNFNTPSEFGIKLGTSPCFYIGLTAD